MVPHQHAAPDGSAAREMGSEATESRFDLDTFLPYLLNQAAESTSRGFAPVYRSGYGMTRTQWRVLANLGRFGPQTAAKIGRLTHGEKTKISRAVAALEARGWLRRETSTEDRRAEILSLTSDGSRVVADLGSQALEYDQRLRDRLGPATFEALTRVLRELTALDSDYGR